MRPSFPRLPVLALCGVMAAGLARSGTDPQAVDAPDIKVGDSWTYDSIDGYKGVKEFTIVSRAAEVLPDRIVYQWQRTDQVAEGRMTATRDLNWTLRESTRGTNAAEPFYPSLSFPLTVGKTWRQKVHFVAKYEQERIIDADLKGTVVGWEDVEVPAGTFRALKIEIAGDYRGESGNFTWKGYLTDRIWYVPEVKRAVRTRYEDTASGHGYFRDWQDLAAYKLN